MTRKCPGCKDGFQHAVEGVLEMCFPPHLPALIWTCTHCARVDHERKKGPTSDTQGEAT